MVRDRLVLGRDRPEHVVVLEHEADGRYHGAGFEVGPAEAPLLMGSRLARMGAGGLLALLALAAAQGGTGPARAADVPAMAVADTDGVDPRTSRSLGSATAPVTVYEM